jgi:hypothetical protein
MYNHSQKKRDGQLWCFQFIKYSSKKNDNEDEKKSILWKYINENSQWSALG